jgi:putative ABC transport system permease protein
LDGRRSQILSLFLGEAIVLSTVGGFVRLGLGIGIAHLLRLSLTALPVNTSWNFVILAKVITLSIGLIAGVLPARRPGLLNPVEARWAE